MFRILLAVTALLIYGSLYPWQFHGPRYPGGPLQALIDSWQFPTNRFDLFDIAINVAIYLPFGVAAYLWLARRTVAVRFTAPIVLAAVLSTSIEIAQFYDARRFTSSVDIATNVLGAAIGMLIGTVVPRRGKQGRMTASLFLLACWLGAMLFPLIPDISRTHLRYKLSGFFLDPFAPALFFALMVMWLVAGRFVNGQFFPLLGLVLPFRFLITGLSSGWMQWATFLAAWALWVAFFGDPKRHDRMLAALVLISVAWTGLSPFHLSARAASFSWVPLRPLFSTDWETGFTVLLRKVFQYGASIWLLRESGVSLRAATAVVTLFLAAIEVVQIYLPNHVAEITDPLVALFLAWALARLSKPMTKSVHAH